jgi:hypothetical protein
MNLVWSAIVIVVTVAVTVTAMLLVRRRASEGSRFIDGDRKTVLAVGCILFVGTVVWIATFPVSIAI